MQGEEVIACIDPLANIDLTPLTALLNNEDTSFVVHSASQDMEVLHQAGVGLPRRLFDTQVAAALLGYGDQISYAELVSQICDVALAKGETQTDWSKRPLTAAQLDYAADDVRYLGDIYNTLTQQVTEHGRETWLQEEMQTLLRVEKYEPAPDSAWKRMRKAQRLDTAAQHRLKALAVWREATAIRKDLPRKWVVDDDVLIEVAETSAATVEEITLIASNAGSRIGSQIVREMTQEVATVNQNASEAATGIDTQPVWTRSESFTPEQRKFVKKLMQQCREKAEELNISASLMASRSAVETLFRGTPGSELMTGWRREIIGNDLVETIRESLEQN